MLYILSEYFKTGLLAAFASVLIILAELSRVAFLSNECSRFDLFCLFVLTFVLCVSCFVFCVWLYLFSLCLWFRFVFCVLVLCFFFGLWFCVWLYLFCLCLWFRLYFVFWFSAWFYLFCLYLCLALLIFLFMFL